MTHSDLVQRAVRWLRKPMGCGVVLAERHSFAVETPDAIGWKYGVSHLVECKVSRADFRADASKRWRQQPDAGMGGYRWYVAPVGLLVADEVPAPFGFVEATDRLMLVRRKAERLSNWSLQSEVHLLVSELRRYQLHGITYPPLAPVRQLRTVGGAQ